MADILSGYPWAELQCQLRVSQRKIFKMCRYSSAIVSKSHIFLNLGVSRGPPGPPLAPRCGYRATLQLCCSCETGWNIACPNDGDLPRFAYTHLRYLGCSHVATTGQVGTNHDAKIAGLFRRNTLIWANRLSRPRVFDSYLDHGKDSLIIFRMRGKQVMHRDFAKHPFLFFRQAGLCARLRSTLMFCSLERF
jgi:hypothetical protein